MKIIATVIVQILSLMLKNNSNWIIFTELNVGLLSKNRAMSLAYFFLNIPWMTCFFFSKISLFWRSQWKWRDKIGRAISIVSVTRLQVQWLSSAMPIQTDPSERLRYLYISNGRCWASLSHQVLINSGWSTLSDMVPGHKKKLSNINRLPIKLDWTIID